MALPLFCKRLGNDLGLEALFGIHLLEPLVFLFKLLHPGHQRGVHAAELGPPFVERGRAHAMLAAQFGDGGAGFSLFEDGDNLAVGVTGDLHAELSKSYLENSTHKSACLQGGLPFQGLPFLRVGIMACARVARWHHGWPLVSYAPSPMTLAMTSFAPIWSSRHGSIGASPVVLSITSMARISKVVASTTNSPSPNILMPVLSTSRCNPVLVAFAVISTARYFWRRLTVLKSGTSQSNPASLSRLCVIPVACRSARLNSPLMVKQN